MTIIPTPHLLEYPGPDQPQLGPVVGRHPAEPVVHPARRVRVRRQARHGGGPGEAGVAAEDEGDERAGPGRVDAGGAQGGPEAHDGLGAVL